MGLRNAGNQRKKEKTHPQAGDEKVKALLNSAGHKIRPSRDHRSHGQVAGLHDCTGTEWLLPLFHCMVPARHDSTDRKSVV